MGCLFLIICGGLVAAWAFDIVLEDRREQKWFRDQWSKIDDRYDP